MALSKRITLPNGIACDYHRVVSLSIVTNVANLVEACSYTSEAKRAEERAATAAGEAMDVYTATRYYEAPYDQGMTVEGAYAWLKANVEEFADAEDVLEDDWKEA